MLFYIVIGAIAATIVGFAHYKRGHARALVQRTRRYYAVSAPEVELPSLRQICKGLARWGYKVEIASQRADADGTTMHAILVDERQPEGRLHLALSRTNERIDGDLESEDTGPEFYEEMARYAILVMSELIPDLHYASPGDHLARADTLAEELPDEPLGFLL